MLASQLTEKGMGNQNVVVRQPSCVLICRCVTLHSYYQSWCFCAAAAAAVAAVGVPTLINSVNGTRLQVNQTTTLRIRADNLPPNSPGSNSVITAAVTVAPAGIVSCTPAKPRFGASNVATATCRGRKVGVATVTVTFAGASTTRTLRVV
jgi:hypothetical protein